MATDPNQDITPRAADGGLRVRLPDGPPQLSPAVARALLRLLLHQLSSDHAAPATNKAPTREGDHR